MRFILVTNSLHVTDQQRDLITGFLEGKGWSVWHWFKDLWLVDEAPDDLSFASLREEIQGLFPYSQHLMIMSTEGKKNHAGFVPKESKAWLGEHWLRR